MTEKRKLPTNEKILQTIREVLRRRIKVESQEELGRIVLVKLKKEDKNFLLRPQRVKQLALMIPEVMVKAKTRSSPRMKKIDCCPICSSVIAPLTGRNLLNKKITIGYKCLNCAYQSDLEHFMPMKYIFVWKS
jgi:hypothetical protein